MNGSTQITYYSCIQMARCQKNRKTFRLGHELIIVRSHRAKRFSFREIFKIQKNIRNSAKGIYDQKAREYFGLWLAIFPVNIKIGSLERYTDNGLLATLSLFMKSHWQFSFRKVVSAINETVHDGDTSSDPFELSLNLIWMVWEGSYRRLQMCFHFCDVSLINLELFISHLFVGFLSPYMGPYASM